jgi:hypothetical protein
MRTVLTALALALLASTVVRPASAQAQQAPPAPAATPDKGYSSTRVLGEVASVDKSKGQVLIKTAEGQSFVATTDERTVYKRIPPGSTSLDKAVSTSLDGIDVGDRVIARGRVSTGAVQTRELIVISKLDIEQRRARERAEWARRGILGTVSALDATKKEITVQARTPEGDRPVVVAAGAGEVRFLRYAPDSVRYRDARQSAFAELKVGDQFRALGERSADGARFTPEEVVSGTFRTTAGKITAVNAQAGELTISTVPDSQPLTVVVSGDSKLRRLSPEVSKLWEQRVTQPGSGSGSIQEMIDNLPPISLADLKAGDAVVVSSTAGSTPSRVTAITLAAGVESLVKRLQEKKRVDLNLGLGLPSGVNP